MSTVVYGIVLGSIWYRTCLALMGTSKVCRIYDEYGARLKGWL
jgi:hypothetical protein